MLAGGLAPFVASAQEVLALEEQAPASPAAERASAYDSLFASALVDPRPVTRPAAVPASRARQAAVAAGVPPQKPATYLAPLFSAFVPGSGQVVLHQARFVPYLLAETFLLSRYIADVDEGQQRRREYRSLAASVARALYSDTRPVGDWDYYERMEHYVESGVYDRVLGGSIDPETDPATFNGSVWELARRTFWSSPDSTPDPASTEYRRALSFYVNRAIRPEFRWSWRNAQLEHDVFRRTIERSNDAFQRSVQDLSLLLANHVLSTVDALVTVRVRRRDMGDTSMLDIGATLPWPSPRRAH